MTYKLNPEAAEEALLLADMDYMHSGQYLGLLVLTAQHTGYSWTTIARMLHLGSKQAASQLPEVRRWRHYFKELVEGHHGEDGDRELATYVDELRGRRAPSIYEVRRKATKKRRAVIVSTHRSPAAARRAYHKQINALAEGRRNPFELVEVQANGRREVILPLAESGIARRLAALTDDDEDRSVLTDEIRNRREREEHQ